MAAKQKPACPRCDARQKDWLLCEQCTELARSRLQWLVGEQTAPSEGQGTQTLPWERQARSWDVDDELLTSLARQGCGVKPTVGRSSGTPLPFDERSHDARRRLDDALSCAVAAIFERGTDVVAPSREQWLLACIERLRSCIEAAQVVDAIDGAVAGVIAVIDSKRDEPARIVNDPRMDTIGDELATRRDILDAMPTLVGHRITTQRFSMWVARGRLVAHSDGRYRVGDVTMLAGRTP